MGECSDYNIVIPSIFALICAAIGMVINTAGHPPVHPSPSQLDSIDGRGR